MPRGIYIRTKKHRINVGKLRKGKIPWNKGKKLCDEIKNKISKTLKGHIVSKETKIKIGNTSKGRKPMLGKYLSKESRNKISNSISGNKNPRWKGGISFERYGVSKKEEKELREKIRKRDNYKCLECNITQEDSITKFNMVLFVHHIDGNKHNWKGKNLITLCCRHHIIIYKSKNRDYWIKHCKELLKKGFFIKGNKY